MLVWCWDVGERKTVNWLFFFFYIVRGFEKEDFIENSHILSCFVQLKSVLLNLLCVLNLASKNSHFVISYGTSLSAVPLGA